MLTHIPRWNISSILTLVQAHREWAMFISKKQPSEGRPGNIFNYTIPSKQLANHHRYTLDSKKLASFYIFTCCSAQTYHNQFKPVQQIRQQVLRGYCPNMYTVLTIAGCCPAHGMIVHYIPCSINQSNVAQNQRTLQQPL